jgi:adenine deaminase
VQGFGLKTGAIASSVAHDSHNIISVGTSDDDLAAAVSRVAGMEGGLVAVKDGTVLAEVPLPLAGLISLEDAPALARRLAELLRVVRDELGCELANPFMTLSFLALPVIPHLKLTDRGLVDVGRFDFVSLFVNEDG